MQRAAELVGTPELIESYGSLRATVSRFGSGRALGDCEAAAALLREPEVLVIRWPADGDLLDRARAGEVPRLLVVEAGDEPPAEWDAFEDWVRLPADARDVEVRVASLRRHAAHARPRPAVDGFDRLLYDRRWVALSPNDYKLIEPLVERFDEVVPYEEIVALLASTDGGAPVAGRVRLTRLRRRIAPLGLEIRTVRPHGLSLTTRCEAR